MAGCEHLERIPPYPSNPRSISLLLYPPLSLLSLSPSLQRQWWQFKSQHLDKVLLFKMGKFYELFEMDAHVGAKELDLQYMKVRRWNGVTDGHG